MSSGMGRNGPRSDERKGSRKRLEPLGKGKNRNREVARSAGPQIFRRLALEVLVAVIPRVVGEQQRAVLAIAHINGVVRMGCTAAAVDLQDPLNIILRLTEGRDGPPPLHCGLAGVVRSERERQVPLVAVNEIPQISDPAVDIVVW